MSQATFHAPRRKRKVYESYESPFPIPLSHDVSVKDFRICQAEVVNNYIIVRNPEDIELLYSKGYFGKGILSRSRPEYNIEEVDLRSRWKAIPSSKRNIPIISSEKYQRHVQWARSLLEAQGLDTTSAHKIIQDYCRPIDVLEDRDEAVVSTDYTTEKHLDFADLTNSKDEASVVLEGNSLYDPLAKYGSEEETQEPCSIPDKEDLEKMHCHRHDDLIIHCGCKPQKQISQSKAADESVIHGGEHEYVLVEEKEEFQQEDEDMEDDKNETRKCKLVCRRNPFRMFEYLQLSREEAFFLVYALGCLSVSYKKEPVTIQKLWEVFSTAQKNFQTNYMVYHHFRSKGWVPKVGLKYGTDLLLYRKGPPFYHASYSVMVELADANYEGTPLRPLTWRSLSGLNRTTMNASKELLICYLIKPPDFTEQEMLSPNCIKKFKVQEVIVSRWISSRERMEHDEF